MPLCLVRLVVVFVGQKVMYLGAECQLVGAGRCGVMGLFPSLPLPSSPFPSLPLPSSPFPSLCNSVVCVQPYAWQSREHLRRLLVGQDVRFAVEYKVPSSGREYGTVWVRVAGEVKCANEEQVSAGWAEVRTGGKSE